MRRRGLPARLSVRARSAAYARGVERADRGAEGAIPCLSQSGALARGRKSTDSYLRVASMRGFGHVPCFRIPARWPTQNPDLLQAERSPAPVVDGEREGGEGGREGREGGREGGREWSGSGGRTGGRACRAPSDSEPVFPAGTAPLASTPRSRTRWTAAGSCWSSAATTTTPR